MKRLAELVLYPILAISGLVLFLYPAFLVPEALRLYLIFLGLAGIVLCCYLVHWYRYPGIFRSKSLGRWLGHIVLATALLVLAPIVAVLHLTGITKALGHLVKLNKLLGLDFRFDPGERVRIRSDAPSFFRPEAAGCVLSVQSVQGTNLASPYPAKRTICYLIQFDDGVTLDIPEQFLAEAASFRFVRQFREHWRLGTLQLNQVSAIDVGGRVCTRPETISDIVRALKESQWFTSSHGGWASEVPLTIRLHSGEELRYRIALYLKEQGAVIIFLSRQENGGEIGYGYAFSRSLPAALVAAGAPLPSEIQR